MPMSIKMKVEAPKDARVPADPPAPRGSAAPATAPKPRTTRVARVNKDLASKELADQASGLAKSYPVGDPPSSSQPGRIRNMAGFWATQAPEDGKSYRKKRLEVDDSLPPEGPAEAALQGLGGVLRAAEETEAGERQQPIEIDEGHARNIASLFQNGPRDTTEAKKPFRLDVEGNDGDAAGGNTGASAGGIGDKEKGDSVARPTSAAQRRRMRDLAGTFTSTSREEEPPSPRGRAPLERAALGASSSNNSTDGDRLEDTERPDPATQSGRTRGLAERWKQQQLQQQQERESELADSEEGRRTKPAWLLELESAKESDPAGGVYENEPAVRDDVIRFDDELPDVISAKFTRTLRQMWTNAEREALRNKEEEARAELAVKSRNVPEAAAEVTARKAATSRVDQCAAIKETGGDVTDAKNVYISLPQDKCSKSTDKASKPVDKSSKPADKPSKTMIPSSKLPQSEVDSKLATSKSKLIETQGKSINLSVKPSESTDIPTKISVESSKSTVKNSDITDKASSERLSREGESSHVAPVIDPSVQRAAPRARAVSESSSGSSSDDDTASCDSSEDEDDRNEEKPLGDKVTEGGKNRDTEGGNDRDKGEETSEGGESGGECAPLVSGFKTRHEDEAGSDGREGVSGREEVDALKERVDVEAKNNTSDETELECSLTEINRSKLVVKYESVMEIERRLKEKAAKSPVVSDSDASEADSSSDSASDDDTQPVTHSTQG